MREVDAYCDGGVCGRNPSTKGGSWAVVYVDCESGDVVAEKSGHFTPADMGLPEIENNLSETLGVMKALYHVPAGCTLRAVYGDNANSLRRARHPSAGKWAKVPTLVRCQMRELRTRLNPQLVLIGGHPTKADLDRGHRVNPDGTRGPDVSVYNVRADELCQWRCRQLAASLAGVQPQPPGDREPDEPAGLVPPRQLADGPDRPER